MTGVDFEKSFVQFFNASEISDVKPFGNGHINDTYLVKTTGEAFIFQKVNQNVFDIAALVHNYKILNKSVEAYQREMGISLTPRILTIEIGDYHFIDKDGSAWRKVEFLPESKSYDITTDTAISFAAAEAYGKFQVFLNTLDVEQFQDTIPQFHHLENRMKQFEEALNNAPKNLLDNAAPEIGQVEKFKSVGIAITHLLNTGKLPLRLSHYDTKLNNIIFHESQAYVIDLDTVMQGSVLFDFGDMVRTFTSPAAEDEPDIEKTIFRLSHFEALTNGYLGVLKNELTATEKQNLLLGAKAIIYEQALRFLSDYFNGNIYYKTAYPEHNLVRCRTQLKLLEEIFIGESKAVDILNKVLNL